MMQMCSGFFMGVCYRAGALVPMQIYQACFCHGVLAGLHGLQPVFAMMHRNKSKRRT
jgi:hypothetical protein